MKLSDLIEKIQAKVLTVRPSYDAEVEGIYAGDRISDLLTQGAAGILLVTNLAGVQVLRVVELMDVPALCLLNGIVPEPEVIRAGEEHGAVLLVSPFDMFETCGRLYERFSIAGKMRQ
ncbi:hypothetical protein ACFL5Q_06870 [Planctomycetota bacterium]